MQRICGLPLLLLLLSWGSVCPASAADESALDELVVTGSRIPTGEARTTPLTVLDEHDFERSGLDSLGKVLQTLPSSTTSLNTNVNNGGDGSERLDLRGVGPKRTLLLLNGRRLPNGGLGGDDSVDLSALPLSMIERVEVQTSGATAIYGADAVAGVVNVITRQELPEVVVGLKNSLSERGDGRITTAQIAGGHDIGNGHWLLGGEFTQQRPVTMDQRGYSAAPEQFVTPDHALGPASSRTTPDGRFVLFDVNALGLDPGFYNRIPGSVGQSPANYLLVDRTNPFPPSAALFNYAPYNYLQTPYQREAIWLLGSQPLAGGVTLFAEGLWHARKSSQLGAATPYNSGIDATPVLPDGELGIPADNYYNPFGIDVFGVRRRFVELPQRETQEDIGSWRALLGLRGELANWHWEVSYSEAHSHSVTVNSGLVSGSRLLPAVGPSGPDASGSIVCGSRDASGIVPAANVIPGCVPVDLFDGAGSLTRAQVDYLNVTLRDHGDDAQRLLTVTAQGPLGALPAGPIQWSVGAEYRRESGSLIFDPLSRDGIVSYDAQSDIAHAQFDAREVFLEVRAPLLDSPVMGLLDATAGLRYSHFSTFGTNSTWEAGLRYQPTPSFALRATYAQVLRVPSLQELYRRQSRQRLEESTDPCGHEPSPVQQAHCAANGVPGGVYEEIEFDEWDNVVGGNPQLTPERGDSFDAGIEFQPSRWPHLRMSVDYFNIELHGFIENPLTADVLQECADRGTPSVCAAIHRNPDGTIQQVDTMSSNFGRIVSSGFDAASRLYFDALGSRVTVGIAATYLARRDTQPFSGGAVTRGAGYWFGDGLAYPRWRGTAFAEIRRQNWHLSYSTQLIGPYSQCGDGENYLENTDCTRIESRLYHDIEGGLTGYRGIEFVAGITNLGNANPPFVNGGLANTDTATYRLLGRTYFAGIRVHL